MMIASIIATSEAVVAIGPAACGKAGRVGRSGGGTSGSARGQRKHLTGALGKGEADAGKGGEASKAGEAGQEKDAGKRNDQPTTLERSTAAHARPLRLVRCLEVAVVGAEEAASQRAVGQVVLLPRATEAMAHSGGEHAIALP